MKKRLFMIGGKSQGNSLTATGGMSQWLGIYDKPISTGKCNHPSLELSGKIIPWTNCVYCCSEECYLADEAKCEYRIIK